MNTLLFFAGLGCTILIAHAIAKRIPEDQPPTAGDDTAQETVALSSASRVWKESTVAKEILPATALTMKQNVPVYKNSAITEFYSRHIFGKGQINHYEWVVLCRILELIDKYGYCPSVVTTPAPLDAKHPPDPVAVLAHTPLWEHLLAVAEHLVQSSHLSLLIGRDLIVALSHDIGKIPEFHHGSYLTGDHPCISTNFLEGIPEFNKIYDYRELLGAVGNHHLAEIRKDTLVGRLRYSDQEVRSTELSRWLIPMVTQGKVNCTSVNGPTPATPGEMDGDLYVLHSEEFTDNRPRRIDISGWFRSDIFLGVIKENVNKVSGGWWNAVSMLDGYIFCSPKGMFNLLNRAFRREPPLLAAYANTVARQDILYSVVMELSGEYKDLVALEHLDEGEYCCPVSITTSTGKIVEGKNNPLMMTPFRAKPLGVNLHNLDAEKSQTIRRMVTSINFLERTNLGHGSEECPPDTLGMGVVDSAI